MRLEKRERSEDESEETTGIFAIILIFFSKVIRKFMRFLIPAIFSGAFLVVSFPVAGQENFDLPRITTENGRVYDEIFILGGDENGLLFRHRDGIAKVDFAELSEALQALYQPVSEEMGESGPGEAGQNGVMSEVDESETEEITRRDKPRSEDWVIEIYLKPRYQVYRVPCSPVPWPSHWSRFIPATRLAVPYYREWAVRDFLLRTGRDGCGHHLYFNGHLPVY